MEQYFQNNLQKWNASAVKHYDSRFYDVAGFRNSRNTLNDIETEEVGDVAGKTLLHLQCHFGLDTLSWARRGAKVTGIDFSDEAIALARRLSGETGIPAEFVCSNLYDLSDNLEGEFDIVYTSAGVLCWLPDIQGWADVIAQFLKSGGTFYILEQHPILNTILTDDPEASGPEITRAYFYTPEPEECHDDVSYTGDRFEEDYTTDEWNHSISDIVNALLSVGLKIEFLNEYPKLFYPATPYMVQDPDGYWWHIPGDKLPLIFTLKATKP